MKAERPCKYSDAGVICTDRSACGKCGWNPEVTEKRLKKMGIKPKKERRR